MRRDLGSDGPWETTASPGSDSEGRDRSSDGRWSEVRKEITLTVTCTCNFWVERVFYTNEHGYFEISDAYCPDCFSILTWAAQQLPIDITEESKK